MPSWLDSFPQGIGAEQAIEIIGALGTRIAERRECDFPQALPHGDSPLVDELPDEALVPDSLGTLWERLMFDGDRRRRGAHFTPARVSSGLCEVALDHGTKGAGWVWDPAVGGGSFLLAMARALESRYGLERADIVSRMTGTDIDPISLRVADAAIELWSLCGARPTMIEADALLSSADEHFDFVIGNPPFLSQLSSETARPAHRREALDERFGGRAGYTDEAGLFLLEAVRRTKSGGVVALLMPQSLLGSAAARIVRDEVAESADLVGLWVEGERSFQAQVEVMAPIIVKRPATPTTQVRLGSDSPTTVRTPHAGSWSPLVGEAMGVPSIENALVDVDGLSLGDLAAVTAGFRQHFYGIADAVAEEDFDSSQGPRLVTAGAIEPLQIAWGRRPIKFARTRWERPVVDIDSVTDRDVAKWFEARRCPKVLVASQTRVVEAIADPRGAYVPSVPVISIEPANPLDVWSIAALLTAPLISAYLISYASGTGLSSGAIRVRASDLARLPLPHDDLAWSRAKEAAELAHMAAEAGRWDAYRTGLLAVGREMTHAYRSGDDVFEWWASRLRFPAS